MKRRSTWMLCGVSLAIGVIVGVCWETSPVANIVQADAISQRQAERLYRELDGDENPLIAGSQHLAKIAKLTTPSVVHIQSERRNARGGRVEETGSGVIMDGPKSSGIFVVTNRHVVNESKLNEIEVHLHDGRVLNPTYKWDDPATDVAVLKITGRDLTPARWGDSGTVDIGHMVLAMGSPFGLSRSVTWGIISAKGRRSLRLGKGGAVLNQNFLQTDAAINPGNSGGPLIDMHGRVIGINTAIASNSGGNDGIGFSIPSNLVRHVVEQLLEHKRVQRSYLGVRLDSEFTATTARRLKLDRARGGRVVEVYANTPASRAKLKVDDVVLSFNGIVVEDENHLINLVSLTPVGRRVKLSVHRNGRVTTIMVTLADRDELEQRSEAPAKREFRSPFKTQ